MDEGGKYANFDEARDASWAAMARHPTTSDGAIRGLSAEFLGRYRPGGEGATINAVPARDMTRDELLATIGFLAELFREARDEVDAANEVIRRA